MLTSMSRDGVEAANATSILAALERGSSRNSRRLPWHFPLIALSLGGALLWGYTWWTTAAPSIDRSPEPAKVVSTVTASPPRVVADAGKVVPTGAIAVTVVADAALDNGAATVDAKTPGNADNPAKLIDVDARVGDGAQTSRAKTVERRAVRPTVKPAAARLAPTTSARAATIKPMTKPVTTPKPASSTAKARLPGAVPVSHSRAPVSASALDDADVAVVSALIGSRHTHDGVVSATAQQQQQQPTTIAGLVRQCRALDPAEATACRRRICDGYWGKAQACNTAAAERKTAQR